MQLDYLAPFLAQIGDPEKLSAVQAAEVRESCLRDLKQRLIDMANVIQSRFEKVSVPAYVFLLIRSYSSAVFIPTGNAGTAEATGVVPTEPNNTEQGTRRRLFDFLQQGDVSNTHSRREAQ